MTWTDVSDTTSGWSEGSGSTSLTFTDLGSDTVARNASLFIHSGPKQDAQGGIDFKLRITDTNPFIITSIDPRKITSDDLNDPAAG